MKGGFVLDAAVATCWSAFDQRGIFAEDVLKLLETQPAYVPCHWRLEVANLLLKGQDNGNLSASDAASFLALLNSAPIEVDAGTNPDWILTVRALASRLGASSYEAAYLELCQRLGLPLATEDVRMRNLAASARVELVSP